MPAKQFRPPLASSLLLRSPVRTSWAQRFSSTTVYPSRRRVAHEQTGAPSAGGTTDTLLNVRRMSTDRPPDSSLDWLCIPIAKANESDQFCDYTFSAAWHADDPDNPGRCKVVGQEQGVLRVMKATGDVSVIEQMPGDDGERRAQRAARIVYQHWQQGE